MSGDGIDPDYMCDSNLSTCLTGEGKPPYMGGGKYKSTKKRYREVNDGFGGFKYEPNKYEPDGLVYVEETALDKQVGGEHYNKQRLQPIEATYLRYGYSGVKAALHTKVDKYLSRTKDDELEQLEKAKHCLELLIDFYKRENS